MTILLLFLAFSAVFSVGNGAKLLPGSKDHLGIPKDLLFVEQIVSIKENGSGNYNFIKDFQFIESNEKTNTFAWQLESSIQIEYTPQYLHSDKTFEFPNYLTLFADEIQSDSSNVFLFKGISITGMGRVNAAINSDDMQVMDFLWCAYLKKGSGDISSVQELNEKEPTVSGMENLLVLSSDLSQIEPSSDSITWFSFGHYSASGNSNKDILGYMMVLQVEQLGISIQVSESAFLRLYFSGVKPLVDSSDGTSISCTLTNAGYDSCEFIEGGDFISRQVYFSDKSLGRIYSPQRADAIEIELLNNPTDTFYIAFPWTPDNTGEDGSVEDVPVNLLITLTDENGIIFHQASRANGNHFKGAFDDDYSLPFKTNSYLEDEPLSSLVENFDKIQSSTALFATWFSYDDSVESTSETPENNVYILCEEGCSDGFYSGIVFCSSYNFRSSSFELSGGYDDSSCFESLDFYSTNLGQKVYCFGCIIDSFTSSVNLPFSLSYTGLQLPQDRKTFPELSNFALFGDQGGLIHITGLTDTYQDWATKSFELKTLDVSLYRDMSNQRLQLDIDLPIGLVAEMALNLVPENFVLGGNELAFETSDSFEPRCSFVSQSTSDQADCLIIWGPNTIQLKIQGDIDSGSYFVNLFGLLVESSLDDPSESETATFSLEILGINSAPLLEGDKIITVEFKDYDIEEALQINSIEAKYIHPDTFNVLVFSISVNRPIFRDNELELTLKGSSGYDFFLDQAIQCVICEADSVEVYVPIETCVINDNSVLLQINDDMDSSSFDIWIKNYRISEDGFPKGLYASVKMLYNGGIKADSSFPVLLPHLDSTPLKKLQIDLKSTEHFFQGQKSVFHFEVTLDEGISFDQTCKIIITTSSNFETDALGGYFNGEATKFYQERSFEWFLYDGWLDVEGGTAFSLDLYGLVYTNDGESEENRQIGIGIYSEDDDQYLAYDFISLAKPEALSDEPYLLYPRYLSFSSLQIRETSEITFTLSLPVDFQLTTEIWVWFVSKDITSQVTEPEISVYFSGNTKNNLVAESTFVGVAAVATLSQAISSSETLTISITGISNGNWVETISRLFMLEFWNRQTGQLVAQDSPSIYDWEVSCFIHSGTSFEFLDYLNSIEIMVYRGFVTSLRIGFEDTNFNDQIEFSIGESIEKILNQTQFDPVIATVGYPELQLSLGISEIALKGRYSLKVLTSVDDDQTFIPFPLMTLHLDYKVSSFTVNEGVELIIPFGQNSHQIPICLDDLPTNPLTITIELDSESGQASFLVYPTEIELSFDVSCSFFVIVGNNTNLDDDVSLFTGSFSASSSQTDFFPSQSFEFSFVSTSNAQPESTSVVMSSEDDFEASFIFSTEWSFTSILLYYVSPIVYYSQSNCNVKSVIEKIDGTSPPAEYEAVGKLVPTGAESFSIDSLYTGVLYEGCFIYNFDEDDGDLIELIFETTKAYDYATFWNFNVSGELDDDDFSVIACQICREIPVPVDDLTVNYHFCDSDASPFVRSDVSYSSAVYEERNKTSLSSSDKYTTLSIGLASPLSSVSVVNYAETFYKYEDVPGLLEYLRTLLLGFGYSIVIPDNIEDIEEPYAIETTNIGSLSKFSFHYDDNQFNATGFQLNATGFLCYAMKKGEYDDSLTTFQTLTKYFISHSVDIYKNNEYLLESTCIESFRGSDVDIFIENLIQSETYSFIYIEIPADFRAIHVLNSISYFTFEMDTTSDENDETFSDLTTLSSKNSREATLKSRSFAGALSIGCLGVWSLLLLNGLTL